MPCCWYIDHSEEATARSLHPGGVHVLFLDGAARFVRNEVDRGLWHVMHSRDTPAEVLAQIDEGLWGGVPAPLLESMYWFAVNWNFDPRTLRNAEAPPAKNFVASVPRRFIALVPIPERREKGARRGLWLASAPVSAPGTALGSHLCVALSSVQAV